MGNSAYDGFDEKDFFDKVKAKFVEKAPNLSQSLNIAVIGKVSSGKSSLINALLKLSRKQAMKMTEVGARSGVQTDLVILKLDEKVYLIDSPGLDDVRAENSEVTKNFLKHIDVGIFVVTGSSDASQKKNLDDLRQHCDSIFVVLNKIDQWDDLRPKAIEEVIEQWKKSLGIEKIYPTCAKGYDPQSREPKMDIRGVFQLRQDIEDFLEKKGKDLLLKRHMAEKQSYAIAIIATALAVVAGEAFIPGSAVLITATQGVAIASLYYLYTGKILSPKTAIAILPTFLAQTAGSSLFLFVKSFLPPTGIVDVAAAGVAVIITLALLATVNHILSSGAELEQEELLRSKFRTYHQQAKEFLKDLALTDISQPPDWSTLVTKFLGSR
ncbi:GTP-binding protein [[Phormidium ambiguum] IAM M-71]|uniref:GTP-binding protein n=2 Tax=[Phormidium ambiguum] IAM M-71 TaxID=454136 RepID=A0A1U7IN71_9CYAN|nr:GTP-binding protein [Phormidium ambiguum IAM M-71]